MQTESSFETRHICAASQDEVLGTRIDPATPTLGVTLNRNRTSRVFVLSVILSEKPVSTFRDRFRLIESVFPCCRSHRYWRQAAPPESSTPDESESGGEWAALPASSRRIRRSPSPATTYSTSLGLIPYCRCSRSRSSCCIGWDCHCRLTSWQDFF